MPTHQSNDTVFGGFNVFLQSKNATTKTNNNSKCSFFLDSIIQPSRNDLGMLVSCLDAEIPYSWYNISASIGNNSITINDLPPFVLPDRNYSAFNIADAFTTLLIGLGITMTFNDDTNKFTLQSAQPFTFNSSTMAKELGFGNLPAENVTLHESNDACNLAGTSSVYIRCPNMGLNNLNSLGKNDGILSKVLVNTSPSSYIFFQPSNPQYFIVNNPLQFISVELINDDGNYIAFNNLDWSLTLSIEFFRKRDDFINTKYLMDYTRSINQRKDEDPPK